MNLQNKINSELETIIDSLNISDLKTLHHAFLERGYSAGKENTTGIDENNLTDLRSVIKIFLKKISMEDLKAIAPDPIKSAINTIIQHEHDKPIIQTQTNTQIQSLEIEEEEEEEGTEEDDDDRHQNNRKPDPFSTTLTVPPEKPNTSSSNTIQGVNICPTDTLIGDTPRRILYNIMLQHQLHLIPKTERWLQPYSHMGLDAQGNRISLIRPDERQSFPVSLMDLTGYYLVDMYANYRTARHRINILKIENELARAKNLKMRQRAKLYEKELIIATLNNRLGN